MAELICYSSIVINYNSDILEKSEDKSKIRLNSFYSLFFIHFSMQSCKVFTLLSASSKWNIWESRAKSHSRVKLNFHFWHNLSSSLRGNGWNTFKLASSHYDISKWHLYTSFYVEKFISSFFFVLVVSSFQNS